MAETVIGTASIFFTLAMIAVLSFVVGLVIYGFYEFLHTLGRGHKHSTRRRAPAMKVSPSELADMVHVAALHAADSLIDRTVARGTLDPGVEWMVRAELQCALMYGVEGAVLPGISSAQRDVYRRVFRAVSAETMASGLDEDNPHHVFGVMNRKMDAMSDCRQAAPGRLIHVDVVDHCTVALQDLLRQKQGIPEALREVLEDVISSAVTLDLVRIIH